MKHDITPADDALDRLSKVLPGEVTAAFLAIRATINVIGQGDSMAPQVSFAMILVMTALTPLVLPVFMLVSTWHQRLFIAVSFFIWAINIEYLNLLTIAPGDLGASLRYAIPILLILWAVLGLPIYIRR